MENWSGGVMERGSFRYGHKKFNPNFCSKDNGCSYPSLLRKQESIDLQHCAILSNLLGSYLRSPVLHYSITPLLQHSFSQYVQA